MDKRAAVCRETQRVANMQVLYRSSLASYNCRRTSPSHFYGHIWHDSRASRPTEAVSALYNENWHHANKDSYYNVAFGSTIRRSCRVVKVLNVLRWPMRRAHLFMWYTFFATDVRMAERGIKWAVVSKPDLCHPAKSKPWTRCRPRMTSHGERLCEGRRSTDCTAIWIFKYERLAWTYGHPGAEWQNLSARNDDSVLNANV
jgi:hypothetical protein